MKTTLVDQVLAELPAVSLSVSDKALPNEGWENLVHYLLGTQEPWYDRPGGRADFLLRENLLQVYRVTPNSPHDSEAAWAELVSQAQKRAVAALHGNDDLQVERGLGGFVDQTRRAESEAQIKQRVWLAIVMYNLGRRGLSFDNEGAVLAGDGAFGAPVGIAPDRALGIARARATDRFYVATYAHRVREDNDEGGYPVDLVRGRGRMRWYIHEVRLDPRAARFFELEPKPVQRNIALVVAGDERATRPGLPRDYYRDSTFQQAVIDAEDGEFDSTLVLSPRHHVIPLDQIVQDDIAWNDLGWMTYRWAWPTQNRLWRLCLDRDARVDPEMKDWRASWSVWRHPNSRYTFTLFGHSEATFYLTETLLRQQANVETQPGYSATGAWDTPPDYLDALDVDEFALDDFLDQLDLDEDLEEDLRETLASATEQAAQLADLVFIPAPPTLNLKSRTLAPEEALEPIMVMRSRDCDVEQVMTELTALEDLLDEPVNFNILIDAPNRLSAVLRIIHAVLHGDENQVLEMSQQALPASLYALVGDTALDLKDQRLCPLLSFAESLSVIAVLLDDDDRDRLSVWQRTFWAAEMRHGGPEVE